MRPCCQASSPAGRFATTQFVAVGEYGHAISGPAFNPDAPAIVPGLNEWRKEPEVQALLGPKAGGHPHIFPNMWFTNMQVSLRIPRGPLATEIWWFTFENLDPVEDEEFTVWVDVVPLTQMEFAELDPSLLALFEGDLASLTSVLYTIQVRVVWLEGAGEEQVTRTTYAWDPTVLNEALDRGAGTGTGTGTGTGEETPLEPPPQEQP